MSVTVEDQVARPTRRVFDVTGPENLLLLLAAPGDEVALCGGLIAETCARGRPPFVAILGDGAEDGSQALANRRERASRAAAALLGLPDERLLFVGLRHGAIPTAGEPLFAPLEAAMALLSWRYDCNVIGAAFAASGDPAAAWQLASAVADGAGLPLVACAPLGPLPGGRRQSWWELDVAAWGATKAAARAAHGDFLPAGERDVERFLRAA